MGRLSAAGVAATVIVVATASVILSGFKAVVAAAAIVVGEIMYPDYHNSDNHDDPEGLITLEEAEAFTIIARTHKKDLPPK